MKANSVKIALLLGGLLGIIEGTTAQWQQYKAAYPVWPFLVEQVAATGNDKCSVWKSRYQKGEGDESGQLWMTSIEDSYQYQRYQFSGGKPAMVSTYLPSGNRLETMEYFYRDNLLSAIEVLGFDTLQNAHVKYALQYLYYKEKDAPAQRTTLYGHPHSKVRILDEFEFDEEYRLTRQKSTVVGFSPHMDSLLGLQANEKRLISARYEDSMQTKKVFRDMHVILDDRKTYLNGDKKPELTEVYNAKGEKLWTIDYHYEGEQLTKKVYWVRRAAPVSQETVVVTDSVPSAKRKVGKRGKNKTKKAKKGKKTAEVVPIPLVLLEPAIYKVEYFRYNGEGLLEQHMIEEEEQQTVLEYSYFTE
ncbi:MAG: hypothetical protein ACRBFS_15165 [Aureispira sp.]